MEYNKYLLSLKVLDVSVLLKNMSDDIAFQLVVKLFTMAHEKAQNIREYYDNQWMLFGNGVEWEFAVIKHNMSLRKLNDLEIILGDLLATQTKDWRGIPQLINDKQIDIKYLLYEMPRDNGIHFINNYLEHIDDILQNFELEKDSNHDDERKHAIEGLEKLRNQLIYVRNDETDSLKEFEKEYDTFLEMGNEERSKIWEATFSTSPEHQTTEIELNNNKTAIAAVTVENA